VRRPWSWIFGVVEVVVVVSLLAGGTFFLYSMITRQSAFKTERVQAHTERLRERGVVGQ
jgi:hypothetical protein